jgi:hypothetical protein
MAMVELNLLRSAGRLIHEQQRELPQMDELCGAFWATVALRAAGHGAFDGEPVEQELTALTAGTAISTKAYDEHLPPGEAHRNDYDRPLPRTEVVAEVGTSATGVGRAVETLSAGRLAAVPVHGPWTGGRLRELIALAIEHDAEALLANLETGHLWEPAADAAALLDYLMEGAVTVADHSWPVGHFVGLIGLAGGPGGELAIVADTYRSQGYGGIHLQPLDRLAASLDREGGSGGGVIVAIEAWRRAALAEAIAGIGLELEWWDNGSLDLGPIG